jgi:hypothetical protein
MFEQKNALVPRLLMDYKLLKNYLKFEKLKYLSIIYIERHNIKKHRKESKHQKNASK